MIISNPLRRILGAIAASLIIAPAWAAEDAEELTVVGTRSHDRSAIDLAVPVDVLDSSELLRQGDSRMESMLSKLVPSFNVNGQPISDAGTLVRPANMRGLPADSTLVLINGKRRHRSSVITYLGGGINNGSHGPDLSAIPAIALDRVEVLRDGAAAQYGSDAVAGILNFALKDDAEGGSLEARYGQYYYGDGEDMTVAGNMGLPLGSTGFLNLSAEYNTSDPTSRSVQREDAQGLIDAGNTHVRKPAAQIWGAPDIDDNYKLFANASIEVNEHLEIYSFGSYAERTTEGGFFFRNPNTRSGVFDGGRYYESDREGLGYDRGAKNKYLDFEQIASYNETDKSRNDDGTQGDEFGQTYSNLLMVVDTQPWDNDSDTTRRKTCSAIARDDGADYSNANPGTGCFIFNEVFPGGFTPQFGGDIEDESIALGFRGKLADGALRYDLSGVIGEHTVDFYMKNTINPQLVDLGKDIPTFYKPGSYTEKDEAFNLDFTTELEMEALHSPLHVGFGAEYRKEEYEIEAGEKNSHHIAYRQNSAGAYLATVCDANGENCSVQTVSRNKSGIFVLADGTLQNPDLKYPYLGIGSNGFPGFRPDSAGSHDRTSVAAYLDFEADVTEGLLLGLAVRHEDPEYFDSTLDGKFSARYQTMENLALRGSVSSGFRVPTVGQATTRNVTTGFSGGKLTDQLTLPASHPVLQGIADPLEAEESVSVSLGTVFNVGALEVTADYYHIEVKDRIAQTSERPLDCLLLEKEYSGQTCKKDGNALFLGKEGKTAITTEQTTRLANIKRGLLPSVPDIYSIGDVKYFANDFDTTTEGIDIVATYPAEMFGGTTDVTLAANWNQTTVDKRNADTISDKQKNQLEDGLPNLRMTLTADHQNGPWRILGRLRYYGDHIEYHAENKDWLIRADDRWLVDAEVGYSFTDALSVVVGAENLLDVDPDKNPYATEVGSEYPESTPFDFNGGFYYLKAVLMF